MTRSRDALPAVVLTVLALPALPLLPIPDPLAVHWSWSGTPDGAMPRLVAAGGPVAAWAVVWVSLHRAGAGAGRPVAAPAAALAGVLMAVQSIVVVANLGAPSWRDARRLSPVLVAVPLLAGLALRWLALRWTPAPAPHAPADEPPPLPAQAGERPLWVGRAINRGAWAVAALLAVPVLAPLAQGQERGPSGAGLVLAIAPLLVIGLLFSSVRVVVGPQAVLAGLGPWGWPRRRFAMADVRSATAETVGPMDRGGYGYRVGGRGTAMVVRSGEALVLNLRDGGQFTVTVDGAREAASVVNGYLRR